MGEESLDYDYIIVGSGFGGSVSALRLSEKGYKVLVIEKGKWYKPEDFPKTNYNLRKWLWIPFLRFFGIMKITIFRHVGVLSGTGVGGGSLVYANTLPQPSSAFFNSGTWSHLKDWEKELQPHYEKALFMLGANRNPLIHNGDLELKKLSKELGREEHFNHTNVAVFFGKPNETVPDPYFNGLGPERTGCNFCGGCMTGCRINAKNTLDKNYLYLAQHHGAKITAETEVVDVNPLDTNDGKEGYEVTMKSSTRIFATKKRIKARGVIFSGGVLGTIKLLLKLKRNSLPNLSDTLGDNVRTNNETLISVSTLDKDKDLTKGVAIGSILHTDDNSHLEIVRYAKGSNAWKYLHLPYTSGRNVVSRVAKMVGKFLVSPMSYLKVYWRNSWAKNTVVLLFMQTLDSTIKFKRNAFGLMVSNMSSGKRPTPFIKESTALVEAYSKIMGGKSTAFVMDTLAGIPSTAHILGGAVMGESTKEGVIDKNNRVFGYENMFVIDGSMISANPGVNPSLSITAIAEHAMSQIPEKVPTKIQENVKVPQ